MLELVEVLREQVVDLAHTFTQKNGMMFVYQHTDNIEKHPATRDVRSIFYPTRSIFGACAVAIGVARGIKDQSSARWLSRPRRAPADVAHGAPTRGQRDLARAQRGNESF